MIRNKSEILNVGMSKRPKVTSRAAGLKKPERMRANTDVHVFSLARMSSKLATNAPLHCYYCTDSLCTHRGTYVYQVSVLIFLMFTFFIINLSSVHIIAHSLPPFTSNTWSTCVIHRSCADPGQKT